MLLGGFDVPPTIDVPDGDPDAFKEMLRYVYTDSAVITVGNASGLLYLANKYMLNELIVQVVGYLKVNISSGNFSDIYRESWVHEEMREVYMRGVHSKVPARHFLSDNFVELDFDDMRKVAVKSLAVDTLTFYWKLLRWAQEECQW
ncbi:BTB/POZ domain-containing protein 6-A [Aphelenchoides avenae]|nr:BTB/POZ domain-containing protein 6-A [Aphelenchus avenae]